MKLRLIKKRKTPAISITPRRMGFTFKGLEDQPYWFDNDPVLTHVLNVMSLTFPDGERFFVDSVRALRDQAKGPDRQKDISGFIGQEAMHGREHEEYNDFVAQAGIPLHAQEAFVARLLKAVQDYSPQSFQLAATVALEHLTAILGGGLLDLPEILEGADDGYKAIWNWHALEETEHKAVCFDAFEQVVGKGIKAYGLRVGAFLLANALFWSLYLPFYTVMVAKGGGLLNLKGHRSVGGMRASIYNAVPEAAVDTLIAFMADFEKRNG